MSTSHLQLNRLHKTALMVLALVLCAGAPFIFRWAFSGLVSSSSLKNLTEQPLLVVPMGMSQDGPVPLPLKQPDSLSILKLAPGETVVFRSVPGVATFCWLLIAPPQGPVRIMDTHIDRESCKPGVPPSTPWSHAAAEYFVPRRLEELPPAPPELVHVMERHLAQP